MNDHRKIYLNLRFILILLKILVGFDCATKIDIKQKLSTNVSNSVLRKRKNLNNLNKCKDASCFTTSTSTIL